MAVAQVVCEVVCAPACPPLSPCVAVVEVVEGKKVRRQVALPKAHVGVVELVATVGVDPPGVMMNPMH